MSKPRILIARAVFPAVIERLSQYFDIESNQTDETWSKAQLTEKLRDKAGAFTTGSDRIDADVLAACPQLKICANMAVGYNNFDLDAMTARGVLGTNTPDVLTETTADFGFALLMATARRMTESEHYLRRGDWKAVKATIQAMPPSLRAEPSWTYWLGRALAAEDKDEEAAALYRRIADQAHFYGQLALDELGTKVTVPPPARTPVQVEIDAMAANPDLQRSLKFFALRLRFEGTREWNWALRRMNERELLAAAEFARQSAVLDRMLYTSERTRTEFDYTQRFPAPHAEILRPTTQSLGLDMAWVYGVIRQESRFIMDAQSRVGASGLMQVMPSTGKYVAGKIGLEDYVHTKLSDLRTNLLLGSNYLNMILQRFDGSEVLATAAYNAGPGRINGWRAKLDRPLEGAVFVESIPYSETRTYVKNVLANTTNYAAMFQQQPQTIKSRLGTVAPGGTRNELP